MNLVAVDFETYYDKVYSLSKLTTEEYIRDSRFEALLACIAPLKKDPVTGASRFMPQMYRGQQIAAGLATIDWENTALVAWNAHFDASIISWRYGHRIGMPLCAMAMFRMMGLPAVVGGESLDAATRWAIENSKASIVPKGTAVNNALGKRLRQFSITDLMAYEKYCLEDTLNAGYLFLEMLRMGFPVSELEVMAEIIRCYTEPTLVLEPRTMHKCYVDQLRRQQQALNVAGISDVGVLRSDQKFAALLRSLGVEPGMKKNKKGKDAYAFAKSDDFMAELLNGENDTLADLAAARVSNKTTIIASRSKRMLDISQRGPMPVMLRPGGAHTTRLSGGDGTNPQNWSKKGDLRKGLIAQDGCSFIGVDQSQIELRFNGYISGDHELMEMFRNKEDVYSNYGNASGLFDYIISKAKETEDERFLCKGVVLGGGFGSGADALRRQIITLARNLGMKINTGSFDFEAAKSAFRQQRRAIVNNWYDTGRQLDAFTQGLETQRGTDGLVHYVPGVGFRFPNGMHIHYHDLHWEETENVDDDGVITKGRELWFIGARYGKRMRRYLYPAKAVENYVQGLAALMLREQWAEIVRRARREIGIRWGSIKMQVHDELIAHVKDEAVGDYKDLMVDVMLRSPSWAPNIPLDVEVAIGKTYAEIS